MVRVSAHKATVISHTPVFSRTSLITEPTITNAQYITNPQKPSHEYHYKTFIVVLGKELLSVRYTTVVPSGILF